MDQIVINWLRRTPIALILIAGFTAAVYFPGLHGPFVFDDANQILNNPAIAITDISLHRLWDAATSNRTDPLGRPLTTLSFALSHYLANGVTDTFPYKVTGLAIHTINAWLVYWLCMLLFRKTGLSLLGSESRFTDWLPLVTALIWAVHPLNLTSVLYVSQRSVLLSALFVLAGLILFTYGRILVARDTKRGYLMMLAGLLGGIGFGLTGKENAVLLALYVLVTEFTIFRRNGWRDGLTWFYGSTVLLPGAIAVLWIIMHPQFILENYAWRDFSLGERVLTETRVLWFYASLILLPDIRRLSLFHDDIEISHSLVDPWTTLPAVLGLLAVTVLALWHARRYPIFSFAILWFLAGHLLESTVIGLEIAHEHRNYIPSLGPILGITVGMATLLGRRQYIAAAVLPVALVATFGFATYARAHIWADAGKIIEHMAVHHPSSPTAHALRAQFFLTKSGDVPNALAEYRKAADLAPHEAGYLILLAITAAETRVVSTVSTAPGNRPFDQKTDQGIMLEASTLADIGRRLAASPIGSTTEATLKQLHDCMLIEPQRCRSLRVNAEEWYRLALNNRHVSPRIHSNVAICLADLYMQENRFEEALRIAEEWTRREPLNVTYQLIVADAHLHMGHLEEAERAILSIRSSHVDAEDKKSADLLLEKLDKQRNH